MEIGVCWTFCARRVSARRSSGKLRTFGPSGPWRVPSPAGSPAPDIFIMVKISGDGAVTALLCGENPLPAGPKAMGKAENGAARCVFDKKWLKATIDCLNVNRMRFTFRGF